MNFAAHDFPAEKFPFDVYAYPADSPLDVNPVWHEHVAGPGVMRVPGRGETDVLVRIVFRYADGTEDRVSP